MNQDDLKNQAKYIWDRLDDLASSDPDGYKKFIEQQMKERETYMSSPEPKFCFESSAKDAGTTMDVYINVCAWKRILYPSNDTEPLKLMCGFTIKHKRTQNNPPYVTIPVAANDKVLEELLVSEIDKTEFIKLVIELVKHEKKINLDNNFKISQTLFKGDVPADPKRLFVKNPSSEFSEAEIRNLLNGKTEKSDVLSSPETLLQNLSSNETNNANNSGPNVDYIKTFTQKSNQKNNLIEEMETGKMVRKELETPEYSFTETSGDDRDELQLKIVLPLVENTADCDLTISTSEVELLVENLYNLKLTLPKRVDDAEVKARFIKKSHCLILKMPLTTDES